MPATPNPVGLGCGVLEDEEILPEALGELEDEAKPVAIRVIEYKS